MYPVTTAQNVISEQVNQLSDRARSFANEQKDLAARQIGGVVDAVARVADDLADSDSAVAGYAQSVSGSLRQFADTVQNKVYIQDLITSGQLEERLGQPLDPARTHVFLCGNPKMIGVPVKDPNTGQRVYPSPTGVVEILEKRGFRADQPQVKFKGNIHFEEYW